MNKIYESNVSNKQEGDVTKAGQMWHSISENIILLLTKLYRQRL